MSKNNSVRVIHRLSVNKPKGLFLMALMVLGINHQTAPIHLREKVAFDSQEWVNALQDIVKKGLANEVIIISTCNRMEIYGYQPDKPDQNLLLEWLANYKQISLEKLQGITYLHSNFFAVSHLMKVACGLDSLVVGEVEILGQVKSAYTLAINSGTVGKYLGRLFQTTFGVAKRVRTQMGTHINPISIAYVAAKLSKHIFADLAKASVLLMGAGELIQLTLKYLKRLGVQKIWVSNRSLHQARRLATEFKGEALSLEQMPSHLSEIDIVITGTSSVLPLIGKGMIERAIKQRKHRPMFMIDLGLPRNIEPEASELEDVYLYCLDDLKSIAKENRQLRQDAAEQAEYWIEKEAKRFMSWIEAQDTIKFVRAFREQYEQYRDELLEENLHRLRIGDSPEHVLKRLAHGLTNRFLHKPTCRMREAGFERESVFLTVTREIFELNYETIDVS